MLSVDKEGLGAGETAFQKWHGVSEVGFIYLFIFKIRNLGHFSCLRRESLLGLASPSLLGL